MRKPILKPPHAAKLRKYELPPIRWFRERGYRYSSRSGVIIGPMGNPLKDTNGAGYVRASFRFQGRRMAVSVHRLAFALREGRWPHMVDHIDGDRSNNQWRNLREITNGENRRPRNGRSVQRPKIRRDRGVYWSCGFKRNGQRKRKTSCCFGVAWQWREREFAKLCEQLCAEGLL